MIPLIVVENPKSWPLENIGAEIVPARAYLTEASYSEMRGAAVYNLCRDYGYQSIGYYVSLLAAARGHRPLPSVATLQSLSLAPVVRLVSGELDDLIQRSLAPLRSNEFELSIYFGRNVAKRYDRLSRALFSQFPAPFLRARFVQEDERWELRSVRAMPASQIPEAHRTFVIGRAQEYFERPTRVPARRTEYRYDLAILWDEHERPRPPSDERTIKKFIRAAAAVGIRAETIGRDDYARIAEYDALFIRETTAVNHHTYRFAHRAAAEGLVVIDDPESIIRCTNKVYQAELFNRHQVASPTTLVMHEGNVAEVADRIGMPCVLKRPDGAFSQGVVKVESEDELRERLAELFEESELVVAQQWAPSTFDWRIGVLGGQPLYAARYHMARGHWQIVRTEAGDATYGRVEALPLHAVPGKVLSLATRAASLIGGGLYGVDIKEVDGRPVVVEVNDNPSIEAGQEDGVLKDELYGAIMRWFRHQLDARGTTGAAR